MDTVFDKRKIEEHLISTKCSFRAQPWFIREKFLNRKNKRTEAPDEVEFETKMPEYMKSLHDALGKDFSTDFGQRLKMYYQVVADTCEFLSFTDWEMFNYWLKVARNCEIEFKAERKQNGIVVLIFKNSKRTNPSEWLEFDGKHFYYQLYTCRGNKVVKVQRFYPKKEILTEFFESWGDIFEDYWKYTDNLSDGWKYNRKVDENTCKMWRTLNKKRVTVFDSTQDPAIIPV